MRLDMISDIKLQRDQMWALNRPQNNTVYANSSSGKVMFRQRSSNVRQSHRAHTTYSVVSSEARLPAAETFLFINIFLLLNYVAKI